MLVIPLAVVSVVALLDGSENGDTPTAFTAAIRNLHTHKPKKSESLMTMHRATELWLVLKWLGKARAQLLLGDSDGTCNSPIRSRRH